MRDFLAGTAFASTTARAAIEANMRLETILAMAQILGVSSQVVYEFVDDEYQRALVRVEPFSWDAIQERVTNARPS